MAKLDEIVTINIDIAAPAVDSANFDNLLILGPRPQVAPSKPLPAIGAYSDLEEVIGAGFVTTGAAADPVGIAARIAFSQNPRAGRIYIATQSTRHPLISGAALTIINASNYLTDALGIDPDAPMANDLPWLQIGYSRGDVTSMDVEIDKDGATVWGKSLPTTKNANAFVQVALGDSGPGQDQMNIPEVQQPGVYTVTLTAVRGLATSVITRQLQYDGTNWYNLSAANVDSTTPETLTPVETLTEISTATGWYIVCAAGIPESEYEEIAEWTETQTKQFAYTFLSDTDPVGAIYYRSHGWCGLINDDDLPEDVPAANAYVHVGAVAKGLAYPTGSETWAFKRLAALYPAEISTTLRKVLMEGHSNFFSQYAGRNITMNGQVRGGEWIDVIRGRDWLQNDMQLRIFSLLLMRPKIPYTNNGIALVENQMIASLKAATARGIVAPDEWDEDGNLIPGFIVRVPNSQSMTATQRAARVLTGCTFTARLAGAIHVVRVDGVLTYEGGADFGSSDI